MTWWDWGQPQMEAYVRTGVATDLNPDPSPRLALTWILPSAPKTCDPEHAQRSRDHEAGTRIVTAVLRNGMVRVKCRG